jgi:hypothetical protein
MGLEVAGEWLDHHLLPLGLAVQALLEYVLLRNMHNGKMGFS